MSAETLFALACLQQLDVSLDFCENSVTGNLEDRKMNMGQIQSSLVYHEFTITTIIPLEVVGSIATTTKFLFKAEVSNAF